MDDELLTTHLHARRYQPPRSGFEQRIIAAAHGTTQHSGGLWFTWLRSAFGEFRQPQLQLACALVLMLGITLGVKNIDDSCVSSNRDGALPYR